MKKRITAQAPQTGSAFVRYLLAMGAPPVGRVAGWVQAMVTLGADNVAETELVRRYGVALRRECAAAGFVPHCDAPLTQQGDEARAAARRWAARVLAASSY